MDIRTSIMLQDRPVYSREDWQSFVYDDCITFQNKLVVSKSKPWFYFKKNKHGSKLNVNSYCNLNFHHKRLFSCSPDLFENEVLFLSGGFISWFYRVVLMFKQWGLWALQLVVLFSRLTVY